VTGVVAAFLLLGGGIAGAVLFWGEGPLPEPVARKEEKKPAPSRMLPKETPKSTEEPKEQEQPRDRAPPPKSRGTVEERVVAVVNAAREKVGLPAVTLDAARCAGCREHAEYLLKNGETTVARAAGAHEQAPGLPGASETGLQAARSSSVVEAEPLDAIAAWLEAPAHRGLLLDPELKSIALGLARAAGKRCITVFDALRGLPAGRVPGPGDAPAILYPSHRQASLPLAFPGNEVPDPLPMTKDKLGGYPITVTFPPGASVRAAKGWLEDETGVAVPVWFSSPEAPANKDHPRMQGSTVCFIARKPLQAGTRYLVRVEATVAGAGWARSWTFITISPGQLHRQREQRALDRINAFRVGCGLRPVVIDRDRSRACAAHARYLGVNLTTEPGTKVNQERPGLPGYSEAGAEVARRAAIRIGGGPGPADSTDWMLASVLNRYVVLNPELQTVGIGVALQAPRGHIWVLEIAADRRRRRESDAVVFPAPGQKDVPIYLGREPTGLVPSAPRDTVAGYAITATFAPGTPVGSVTARLAVAGKEVPCWVSAPDQPTAPGVRNNLVMLLPKGPLAAATTYTATVTATVAGKPWKKEWSFTTIDLAAHQAGMAKVLLAQVNRVRREAGLAAVSLDEKLSDGCAKHANYVARNLEHPKVLGLGIHDEDPTLPGATPEGARAGSVGVIAVISDPGDSVEGWIATLYHRVPLLDPALKRIGYGQALHPTRGWVTMLDSGSGK
jgi:uncharacterized protein YkwD